MQLSELPALRVAFLIGAGILTAHALKSYDQSLEGIEFLLLVALTLLLLGIQFLESLTSGPKRQHSVVGTRHNHVAAWVWLLTLYLFGISLMGLFQVYEREEHHRHHWVKRVFSEEVWISGRVTSVKEASSGIPGKFTLEVRIDSLGFLPDHDGEEPGKWIYFRTAGRFSLQLTEDSLGIQSLPTPSPPVSGQNIWAEIRLYPAQENRNPGGFNYQEWLNKRGLFLQGVALSYKLSEDVPLVSRLRKKILNRIDHIFSPEAAPFLKAFILGDKSSLDQESKEAFSRAGLSHIMAVSGLHVGFLLTPFWMLLPVFRRWPGGPVMGLLLLIGFLGLYASLTGFSTSVNRASLMAILLGFGSLYGMVRNSLNQMAVAAVMILLIFPAELLEPGFQLSFGAVTLLLLWMPAVQKGIERFIRNRLLNGIVQVMSVTIVVQTGLTPILAFWFGELSLVAPVSNLLVVPLLSFLMPATIMLIVAAPLLDVLPWIVELINGFVEWILFVSEEAGREAFSASLMNPSWTFILVWIGIMWAALPQISPPHRWKAIRMVVTILLAGGIIHLIHAGKPRPLRMIVLDVGQGDALFFQTPSGKNYLIDTGTWSPGWNSGEGVLLPFFKEERIDRIHGLFLTHPHADHIGGAIEVLSTLKVDTVYRPAAQYESQLHQKINRLLAERGIPDRNPVAGESFLLGGELMVFILNPTQQLEMMKQEQLFKGMYEEKRSGPAQKELQNVNNASLVMKWVYGEVSFMLTGDAEKSIEENILGRFQGESVEWLRAHVLKAGHHGSKTSSIPSFIEAVSPEVVIIPLAFRNRYRHPHKEVSDRLIDATGSPENVYFTSLDGPVILFSDSKKIRKIVSLKER